MAIKKSIVFWAVLLVASGAAAQKIPDSCPHKPIDKESAEALAGIWFDRGIKLVDTGRDSEALEAFACSLRMVEHPDTIFNAAQAARLAGRPEVSLELLQRYISIEPGGAMSDNAALIMEELRHEVAQGERMEPHEQTQRLAPSPYRELAPLPEPGKPPVQIAGITTLSAGGALLVGATVLQILAWQAVNNAENTHNFQDEWLAQQDKMERFQKIAIAGFVAGGVAAGTGLALLIVHKLKKESSEEKKMTIIPTTLGLAVVGRF